MQFKIHRKESLYFYLMFFISICSYVGMVMFFKEALLSLIVIVPVCVSIIFFGQLIFIGTIKGNGIKLSQAQFPDIYSILESHSESLQLKSVPDLYLVQGDGILNAFATKFLSRDFIILNSGVLEAAYKDGIDAVSFIIGHELGHIKRGHLSLLKTIFIMPAQFIPFLGLAYSRACEYTCDNIGFELSQKGGVKGMLILASGTTLYKYINVDDIESTVLFREDISSSIAEFFSTHPQLIKRVTSLRQQERESLTLDTDAFVSPSLDFNQKENNL